MQREMRNGARPGPITALWRHIRGSEVGRGALVTLVAVSALTASTVVYMYPPGRQTVAFETTDSSSLTVGSDVRIAGVGVGKISALDLRQDRVRVEAEIDREQFIGEDSQVEVRMLTPVGGYAVTIIPLGERPLGDAVIPAERVRVPYTIGDVLQAAPHVTDEVDAATIEANIDEVADALQQDPSSVASIIDGMTSVASVMDRQRDQVHRVMDMTAGYLNTFNGSREFVFDLIRQLEIVVSTYHTYRVGFNRAYDLLGDVLYRLEPLDRFYLDHSDEVVTAVEQLRTAIAGVQNDLDPAIDQLTALNTHLRAWLGPDGWQSLRGGQILASNICVPIPGRTC